MSGLSCDGPGGTGVGDGQPDVGRRRAMTAGIFLGSAGLLDILAGLAMLRSDPYFDVDAQGTHHLDLTGWTWLRLSVGLLVALCGLVTATQRRWILVLATVGAVASIGLNVLLFPFEPLVAVMVVALDLVALWLLTRKAHSRPPVGRRENQPLP
ncbi:hypothetical protein [Plantactinospora sp. KBS50]|uniref:DUF7144 family membrane protein n=1 Tax=Plantactinospora sp. KBS50 TaxID=2024580 RepID=UPI000BAAC1BA|nr:hypothetical protein [Plantactinospora sp. KBS50]ASW57154.1 hypothetical protein CIK06_27930 [Plantactinospora sp. KBS50]